MELLERKFNSKIDVLSNERNSLNQKISSLQMELTHLRDEKQNWKYLKEKITKIEDINSRYKKEQVSI